MTTPIAPNLDDVPTSQSPAEVHATTRNAPKPDEGPSSEAPAQVRVEIPIDPYPNFDEPYLYSFELLRSNVCEALFSLGRIANAFRFSQFLFYYRTFGCRIGVSSDFFARISECLDLLDLETRSATIGLLISYVNRSIQTAGQDGPIEPEDWWNQVTSEDQNGVPHFRRPLSDRYKFSLRTRAESGVNTQTLDDSNSWLDFFEEIYENTRQVDQRLADWMMAGWGIDRLVRPEMDIDLLSISYNTPYTPSPFERKPIVPTTLPPPTFFDKKQNASAVISLPFDRTRTRFGVGGYNTRDPELRKTSLRLIFSTLSSNPIAFEQHKTIKEFETFVSNWVRLLADKQLQASPISTPKESLAESNATDPHLSKLVTSGDGSHPSHSQGVGEKLAENELEATKDRQNALSPSNQQLTDIPNQKNDPESPLDTRTKKQVRNDWLLSQRGIDNVAKLTLTELANLLTEESLTRGWDTLEASGVSDALRESYKRQYKQPWKFDGRGKKGNNETRK